jgi:hypothetical protein
MTPLSPIIKLRPAILVVLRTSIEGAVSYRRLTTEAEHPTETGELISKWETTRVVRDPDEYAEALKIRAEVRNGIAAQCSVTSAFGLMSPLSQSEALSAALIEARRVVSEFNDRAKTCSVSLSALRGEIAADDIEAARAVTAEVSRMLSAMREGIRELKPDAIRKAANEAKALSAVLSAEGKASVSAAIRDAREAARAIVKRVEKAGEKAADVMAEIDLSALDSAARTFLDFEETPAAPAESLPMIPASLDLTFTDIAADEAKG